MEQYLCLSAGMAVELQRHLLAIMGQCLTFGGVWTCDNVWDALDSSLGVCCQKLNVGFSWQLNFVVPLSEWAKGYTCVTHTPNRWIESTSGLAEEGPVDLLVAMVDADAEAKTAKKASSSSSSFQTVSPVRNVLQYIVRTTPVLSILELRSGASAKAAREHIIGYLNFNGFIAHPFLYNACDYGAPLTYERIALLVFKVPPRPPAQLGPAADPRFRAAPPRLRRPARPSCTAILSTRHPARPAAQPPAGPPPVLNLPFVRCKMESSPNTPRVSSFPLLSLTSRHVLAV